MRNLLSNRYRDPAPSSAPRPPDVRVGWLTERDAARVQRIDIASAIGRPLPHSEVLRAIRAPGAQKCVKVDGTIVAFAFFTTFKETLALDRIAVDPSFRRRGYGRLLIDDAASRLDLNRSALVTEIRESAVAKHEAASLAACRFFARCGFKRSHVADRYGPDPSWIFTRRWNPMKAK